MTSREILEGLKKAFAKLQTDFDKRKSREMNENIKENKNDRKFY